MGKASVLDLRLELTISAGGKTIGKVTEELPVLSSNIRSPAQVYWYIVEMACRLIEAGSAAFRLDEKGRAMKEVATQSKQVPSGE